MENFISLGIISMGPIAWNITHPLDAYARSEREFRINVILLFNFTRIIR